MSGIEFVVNDGVATITIDQPEVRNRVDRSSLEQMTRGLERADADATVKVVVLTGRGAFFCTGGQMDGFLEGDVMAQHSFAQAFIAFHHAASAMSKPLIAAVNGDATAGGFSLLAVADLAIAVRSARFGLPEFGTGLFPMLALATAVHTIPRKRLFDMIYNARLLSAEEALTAGLVSCVVGDDSLDDAVRRQADVLVSKSSAVLALGRRAYEAMLGMTVPAALEHGGAMLVHLLATPDATQARGGYVVEKKPD